MNRDHVAAGSVLLVIVGLFAALGWAVYSFPPRPPVPDPMPAAVEAERRVIYLLHGLTDEGVTGPWICEQANVGRSKPGRVP